MAPRTLPGLGLSGFWALGEDNWKDANDVNLRLLSALVQLRVISATTALPGSPVDGNIYIVPTGGDANKIAIRDLGAWVYVTPPEGFLAWAQDTNKFLAFDGSAWVDLISGGGSSLPSFTGNANKLLAVKADESGAEWVAPPAALPSLTGNAGKFLKVNSGATAPEWADLPASPPLTIDTKTGSYTLVLGDASAEYIRMNVASANNLTVPTNASVAFPIGCSIPIRQVGAGKTTIVATSGVTINTAETLKLRKQHSSAVLIKVDTNEWDLTGDLELAP